MVLVTFALVLNRRPLLAVIPAALAGLLRIHAVAFAAALGVHGLLALWNVRNDRRALLRALPELAPAAAVAASIAALMTYGSIVAKDALLLIHAHDYFGASHGGPLHAWTALVESTRIFWPPRGFLHLYWLLLTPLAVTMVAIIVSLFVTRRWVEGAFCLAVYGMTLMAGSHWGLGRFMLPTFPVWLAFARLSRWRVAWLSYLVVSLVLQLALLLNFVTDRGPAP
jgi:hypothetical protein